MQEVMLINSRQAAKMLGIQRETLARWRMAGRGPRFIRLGSSVKGRAMYSIKAVEDWVEEHSTASTSEETLREVGG